MYCSSVIVQSYSTSAIHYYPPPHAWFVIFLFQVLESDGHVSTWVQWVAEKHREHRWLLFFSVSKVLVLSRFLCAEQPPLDNIVHELSFLCANTTEARRELYEGVKVHVIFYSPLSCLHNASIMV